MPKLQVIISKQHNPFLNLAVETYITDHQEPDTVTLFLWKNRQTVVIGYNQNPYSQCNVQALLDDGGHLMRRRTGGGAVYHDLGNLNFSFIASNDIYDVRKQLSVIQEGLKSYGLTAEISGRNDLLCNGRKFSGNAFFSGKQNSLHHGTILIKTNGELMQRYLIVNPAKLQKNGVKSVASRVVNLSELADIDSDNIIAPLIKAFETIYEGNACEIEFNAFVEKEEIKTIVSRITSHEYLFAKWEHFHLTRSGQFSWGGIEIGLEIDEINKRIIDARIASDCLDTEIIGEAEAMIKGSCTEAEPSYDPNNQILSDIVKLVYG